MNYLCALCGLWFGVASVFAIPQARVEFLSSAEVAPGSVLLGDIAEVSGDPDLVKRLNQLEVAQVNKPGRETRVSANAVKGFFVRAVVDPSQVEFVGEGSVKVRARSGSVEADSIRTLLLECVRAQMGDLKESQDWELEVPRVPKRLAVPEKGGSVRVELSPRFDRVGQQMASIQVLDGDKILSRQQVAFTIRRWEQVVKLKNALRRGETVRAQDVEWVRDETTFQQRKVLRSLADAVGRQTIRAVRAGDYLVDNWLEKPYAVREGESIRLWVRVGGTVVQTVAVAKANGFRGQTIRVQNADSQKIIQAQVSDLGEAWVLN